jgi:hypothetical protein
VSDWTYHGPEAVLGPEAVSFDYSDDAAHLVANAMGQLDGYLREGDTEPPLGWLILLAEIHSSGYVGPFIDDDDEYDWTSALPAWTRRASQIAAHSVDRRAQPLTRHIDSALRTILTTTTVLTVPHLLYVTLAPLNGHPASPPPMVDLPGLRDPFMLALRALEMLGDDAYIIDPELERPEAQRAPTVRPRTLSPDDAARSAAAFELPFAALSAITHDPGVPEWDADFVRNTLQQISLWQQRDDANPQILELLIADVVKRLHERLMNTDVLQATLVELGADGSVANEVARRTVETLDQVTQLGGDDPTTDGAKIDQLVDAGDQLAQTAADGLDDVATPDAGEGRQARAERTRLAIVEGVANGATTSALIALGHFAGDHWTQLQLGLVAAWTWVRSIWS